MFCEHLSEIRQIKAILRKLRRESCDWTVLGLIDAITPLVELREIELALQLPEPPTRCQARIEYRRLRREAA